MEHTGKEPQTVQLERMGEKLNLLLRMAAMNMLRQEQDGYVMEIPGGEKAQLPDAKALFEAYAELDRLLGGDWSRLSSQLDALWSSEAIEMVLRPEDFIPVWRELRMQIVREALAMLRAYGADEEMDEHNSRCFTILGLKICEKVISILAKPDHGAQEQRSDG